jgi:hypothetical protein
MNSELILKDLREQFGKKSLLYSEDIASLLGRDHRVVKTLLKANSLPIAVKKVGNQLGVSIYEVAEWLAKSESFQANNVKKTEKQVKAPSRARASLGKSLLALKMQIDFLTEIYIEVGDLDQQNEINRGLKSELPILRKKKQLKAD